MGHQYGPLGLFREILGTLKGTYRVYSRYIRIPGLRSILGAHGFNLRILQPAVSTVPGGRGGV